FVAASGDAQKWTTSSCALNRPTGVHDVYLRFTGPVRLKWFQFLAAPSFSTTSVVNAASFRKGLIPGAMASISGAGLTSSTNTIQAGGGSLPLELAGTSITINGIFCPVAA